MEKLIYCLFSKPENNKRNWQQACKNDLLLKLKPLVRGELRLLLPDDQVVRANGLIQANVTPLADALICLWLDSHLARENVESVMKQFSETLDVYLVSESLQLDDQEGITGSDVVRLKGFTQVAFLKKPEQLDYSQWLTTWLHSHTKVAIDIQSNFRYVQNRVVDKLGEFKQWDAIVTESFPTDAMDDMTVFYDCPGDEAKMQQRVGMMIDSCARFIDFSQLNVLPCSEYVVNGRC